MQKLDKNKYRSNAAEVIESTGNFLNSVKNPSFIICVMVLLGIGWAAGHLMDRGITMISTSINGVGIGLNKVGDKIDVLNTTVTDQKAQSIRQNSEQIIQQKEIIQQNSMIIEKLDHIDRSKR